MYLFFTSSFVMYSLTKQFIPVYFKILDRPRDPTSIVCSVCSLFRWFVIYGVTSKRPCMPSALASNLRYKVHI